GSDREVDGQARGLPRLDREPVVARPSIALRTYQRELVVPGAKRNLLWSPQSRRLAVDEDLGARLRGHVEVPEIARLRAHFRPTEEQGRERADRQERLGHTRGPRSTRSCSRSFMLTVGAHSAPGAHPTQSMSLRASR